MTRSAALEALPDDAQLPASWVRELLEEKERERIEQAVVREETIAMYCELATRHLSEASLE